ncbi:hypothetical protein CQW23_02189 [Capsicum baccatum]|uniref:DNA-directed RNA polymerase n=1 Tax=Capsicum baccatum TaxID=33114 RepID=A0A2G2XQQ2_CAPBA|nr:hypothetical protein CQW23_02189 [Capsicum baccatum]
MSYFLLDFKLSKDTNLIPRIMGDKDQKFGFYKIANIRDIFDVFRSELEIYLNECVIQGHKLFNDPKFIENTVYPRLHRKLVKSLLMPLVYGKTAYNMSYDLYQELNDILSKEECLSLASLIEAFFKSKYPHIVNLMNLIHPVGWVISALQCLIFYSTPMFTTVQDYMKMEAVKIWVYDRRNNKRWQDTLRISTSKGDRKKKTTAIFANFIHQKDANIAFNMIKEAKSRVHISVLMSLMRDLYSCLQGQVMNGFSQASSATDASPLQWDLGYDRSGIREVRPSESTKPCLRRISFIGASSPPEGPSINAVDQDLRDAVQLLTRIVVVQVQGQAIPTTGSSGTERAASLRTQDFLKLDPPTFIGSDINEDP